MTPGEKNTTSAARLFELDDPAWQTIIREARQLRVPAGTVLMEPGECCAGFMLVKNGRVRVFQYMEDGRELTLYRLESGAVCILSINALVAGIPFEATARAETEVHALVLSPTQFERAIDECAAFRNHILLNVSHRYCDMLRLVQASTFEHLDRRLAGLLADHQHRGLPIRITHQELARELGTTREVISRILKEMERAGLVRLSRGRIDIIDEARLRRFPAGENT